MGTIIERTRKDGSKSFTAQILLKRGGKIAHREAKTFDRKQAALSWMVRREDELTAPGGLDLREDPQLAHVITRYENEAKLSVGSTKAGVLKKVKESEIGELECSKVTSDKLVSFGRSLASERQPQTVGNYFSHLSPIFEIARPGWKYPLDKQQFEDAVTVLKALGLIKKGNQRDRRPTLEELDRLMEHFGQYRDNSCPMRKITAFAIFSTRRQEEITLLKWDDLDGDRILIRDMKDPKKKQGNNIFCGLTPEALAIINSMPRVAPQIFPYAATTISTNFTRACQLLGIIDLHFHDLRHEGISRLFEMGKTIPQVAAVSGHRSWSSLQRYTHLRQTGDKYVNWKWSPAVSGN